MNKAVFLLALLLAAVFSHPLRAQAPAWVQIEAQPTLREAETRARAWAGVFPDVAGYRMSSGWYAIVLGPQDSGAAETRLAALLRERQVPGDSFVADGRNFRESFWPVGEAAAPVAPAPAGTAESTPPTPQEPAALPAVLPDETLAEARRSESLLSRAEREEIQTAMQWFGTYAAGIDGAFGPGTRAGMSAWQEMAGHEPTGTLTTRQRAELVEGWRAAVAELGLERVTEAEAGIEIDLPMGLVRFDRYEPPFVHYDEKDGSGVRVLLISQPGDQASLFGLYDLLQTLTIVPLDGERERRANDFEIRGRNTVVESYAHAAHAGGMVKGFVLAWDPADGERMARVVEAMRTSFRPVGSRALDPGLQPMDEAQRIGMMSGLEVRRPERSRSGFYIDTQGTVLTAAEAVAGCGRITIDGGQEVDVTLADPGGIAVLRPRAALAPQGHARFATEAPRPRAELAVAGFPFEDALPLPTLTFGQYEADHGLAGEEGLARLTLSALPGDAGGPVIDGSGAVVGVLLPPRDGGNRVLPEEVAFIAPASAFAEQLQAAGVALAPAERQGALPPEDLTVIGSDMAVLVSCWR